MNDSKVITSNLIIISTAYLIIGVVISIQLVIFFYLSVENTFYQSILKGEVLLLFLLNLVSLKVLKVPPFHLFNIFLYLFFLFLLGRVFLDIVGYGDFGHTNIFSTYVQSDNVKNRALLNLIIALYSVQIGALIAFSINPMRQNINVLQTKKSWLAISGIVAIILFPFLSFYIIKKVLFVIQHGYFELQKGEAGVKGFSHFVLEQFIWTFLALFLASIPTKRGFYKILGFIILPLLLLQILTGVRGASMTMVLIVFWYYIYIYDVQISWKRVLFLLLFAVFFLLAIQTYRVDNSNFSSIFNPVMLRSFLYSQGYTINTLMYSIEYESILVPNYSLKNLFSGIYELYDKASIRFQNMPELNFFEKTDKYAYSGFILSRQVNFTKFAEGQSMGTSYITELFLYGKEWAQLIGGLLFGFVFVSMTENLKKNHIGLAILILLMPNIIYLPRYAMFGFLANNIFKIILLVFTVAIFRTFKRNRTK